jgi:branched-subunit amino acid permease
MRWWRISLLVKLRIIRVLNEIGHFLAPLGLRVLLAWEFWEACHNIHK